MKILLVCGSYYPQSIGGVENSFRHISAELLCLGHEVKMFSCQLNHDEPSRVEYEGVEIIRYKEEPVRFAPIRMRRRVALGRREIQPVLCEFAPDAIWSREANLTLGIARSGYPGKIFHIFPTTARMYPRGMCINTSGFNIKRRLLMLAVYPFVYRTASRIERELLVRRNPICFSQNVRQHLLRIYGKLAEKTRIVRPGVDTNRFSPGIGLQQFEEIREKYGLKASDPFVVYVGRLWVAKNIPMLVEAVSHLGPSVRLVLVGGGHDEFPFRDYVKKRGLNERVIFVGQQDELLPGFYTMAKVCVLPTTIESFGQTYLESMACGTPVVGFAADGRKVLTATDEIVQDGKTGRIVQEVSPQALAEGISEILDMPDSKYCAMSRDAAKYVKRRFSWRRFVKEMLAFSV